MAGKDKTCEKFRDMNNLMSYNEDALLLNEWMVVPEMALVQVETWMKSQIFLKGKDNLL